MLHTTKHLLTRRGNRVIALFSSINDVTAWPFWKFLQMKKVKGVTDLCILAFNSHGGSFEARIDGQEYTLKNYEDVAGYKQDMLERFIHRWHDPGRTYFVYGGHGMGDYLELERGVTCLQCHELAKIFGDKKFEAIVFDACFMASLECAYHLRNNTRYIGGCEGYLWEPDTSLDQHVFNTYTASAMSRFRDPKHILLAVQRDYCSKSPRADFAVLDTTHVAELRRYVEEHVIQRIYDRATFYNARQQQQLSSIAEEALQHALQNTNRKLKDIRSPSSSVSSSSSFFLPPSPRAVATKVPRGRRDPRIQAAVQFEHALYPSERADKHILDLKSYLIDMAREEEEAALRPPKTPADSAKSPAAPLSSSSSSSISSSLSSSLSLSSPPSSSLSSSSSCVSVLRGGGRVAKGSAHEGLDLFYRVVVSHAPPADKHLYAAHLGGLSVPVFEFSARSRPAAPWRNIARAQLWRKGKEFMRGGAGREGDKRRKGAGAGEERTARHAAQVTAAAVQEVARPPPLLSVNIH